MSGALVPCVACATRLAAAIRTRAISAREAVEACLARIEQVNPRANAVVAPRAEPLAPAAAVEPARGGWRPLEALT